MTVGRRSVICRNCKFEFNMCKMPYSAGRFGNSTDMILRYPIPILPRVARCKRCSYIFLYEKLNIDEDLLHQYIKSHTYKKMLKDEMGTYMIIYNIYKNLGESIEMQNRVIWLHYFIQRV